MTSIHFVVHPLPGTEDQLNDRTRHAKTNDVVQNYLLRPYQYFEYFIPFLQIKHYKLLILLFLAASSDPGNVMPLDRIIHRFKPWDCKLPLAMERSQERGEERERRRMHGNQGKHRVTKRGPALSYPMFTLVTSEDIAGSRFSLTVSVQSDQQSSYESRHPREVCEEMASWFASRNFTYCALKATSVNISAKEQCKAEEHGRIGGKLIKCPINFCSVPDLGFWLIPCCTLCLLSSEAGLWSRRFDLPMPQPWLREVSEKLNKYNLSSHPPLNVLEQTTIKQCVVGPNHAAFLLEDGRICRIGFLVQPDRLELSKPENNDGSKLNSGSGAGRTSRPGRTSDSPWFLSGSETLGRLAGNTLGSRWSSGVGGSGGGSSGRSSAGARDSRRQTRVIRTGRDRGSGLLGSQPQPVIPASVIPEELISQAQVVLQGKSRSVIIRELQRTNLDVNLAVNNLLSRDDEDGDDGDDTASESYLPGEDLMSLLDADIHSAHPSVIIDADAMFSEDISYFGYPSFRRSSLSRIGSSRERDSELLRERESVLRLRERRWLDGASFDNERGSTSKEGEPSLDKKNTPILSPVSLGEDLQWWPEKDGTKFIAIGALYSELVAVSSKGELCQWKWLESEPYRNPQNPLLHHPRIAFLGLTSEKIVLLSANSIRATVATESNKVATWVDETLSSVASKLEHTAQVFPELQGEKIVSLHCCALYTCAQLENNLYWWGVVPFSQRKKMLEKARAKKQKTQI
ncbi:unnamed protein product [Ranitomeya imitator]|uniref:E3 ubiquitin-protein ligase UBR5 ubiquitin-associated domain-containing protein n=1 Tax=Ranitomeya imitator TaxID=111125 RepID=A0ABN9LQY6_9NEOB|nr:unnamed protein product [Ranitomeya imitator]